MREALIGLVKFIITLMVAYALWGLFFALVLKATL